MAIQRNMYVYKYPSDLIKHILEINKGFVHIGGPNLPCTLCGDKKSVRKFVREGGGTIVYVCHKCGVPVYN